MAVQPHHDRTPIAVPCALITVSDTRDAKTDRSGQLLRDRLTAAGHPIIATTILKDDPAAITAQVSTWGDRPDIAAILLTGGTGIAPRDTTYEAITTLLTKTIPGFGELFRSLSYGEIGSRAMASRAIAGLYRNTLIFSLPGSTNAVRLALDALILPELGHLSRLARPTPNTSPPATTDEAGA